MLFKKLLITMDVSQYNIYNRYNNHQPALTPVFNLKNILEKLFFKNSASINNH